MEALKGTTIGAKLEFITAAQKNLEIFEKRAGVTLGLTKRVELTKEAVLQKVAKTPRYYPFGILPGGLVATGGVADVPSVEHRIGYVRETPEGLFEGGTLPAKTATGDEPIREGDIIYVSYYPQEIIVPDIPGVTHFREREIISKEIHWPGQKIEFPEITFPSWPEMPDIFGGLKDVAKWAAIGIAGLAGIYILSKFIGRKK